MKRRNQFRPMKSTALQIRDRFVCIVFHKGKEVLTTENENKPGPCKVKLNEDKEESKMTEENILKDAQQENLKMPMALRVVRILMIINAVLICMNGLLSLCVPIILVSALLSWLIFAMAKAIKSRRNWPRYVMAGISAISLFICMFPILSGGMRTGYVQLSIVAVIAAVFWWIPTATLFLPSNNVWFVAKK